MGARRRRPVPNSGHVVRGLVRTHREMSDGQHLDAAVRSGDLIIKHQEKDDSWTRAN